MEKWQRRIGDTEEMSMEQRKRQGRLLGSERHVKIITTAFFSHKNPLEIVANLNKVWHEMGTRKTIGLLRRLDSVRVWVKKNEKELIRSHETLSAALPPT